MKDSDTLTTEVVDFFDGDIAPSYHKPVVTTYDFAAARPVAASGRHI